MSYRIIWSEEALLALKANLKYLREHWSQNEAEKFFQRILEFEDLVTLYPKGFQRTKLDPALRKGRIDKHFFVIHTVIGDLVHVLYAIDNRSQISGTF